MDKTIQTVKTKLNKDDKNPVLTVLTIDWTGATAEALKGPATDTLVINLQGGWRRSKKIPAQVEVKATDLIARMGSRSSGPETVETAKARIMSLSKEDRDALIKQMAEEDKARQAAEKAAAKPTNKGAKKDGETRPQA